VGSVANGVVRHSHTSVLVVRGEGSDDNDRKPGRILLALDGSSHAFATTRAAVEIADGTGSELHVLNVLQTPYPGPGVWETGEENLERTRRTVREFVDGQVERIEARTKAAEVHVAYGRPDAEIIRLGEELDAGLVAVGSRGLGGLRRALLGSVSDSVVRHAHCSVLVVRETRSSDRRTERRETRMAEEDLTALASRFDAAWNAHDEEAVLGFFTDDAVVRFEPSLPGEPEAYTGKEEIRTFVRRHMPGFRVESRDHQVAGHQEAVGDRVIWESTVSAESFRGFGVDPAEGTVEAIVKDGKIESFGFSLSQATLEKIQEAGEPM
jgi:nucleotide-binding universal stress UspA family protein/ketosteroid isomerase-like protein